MSRSAFRTSMFFLKLLPCLFVLFCLQGYSQTDTALLTTVDDLQVQLSWKSDSATTDHFIVEQSNDDINFKIIGIVRWSKEQHQYLYEFSAEKGKNYFRIKRIYANGEQQYSNTVLINAGYKINITAFPNPSAGRFTVSHPLATGKEKIQITNAQGTVVYQTNIARSSVHTALDLSHLEKATYHLVWQDENGKVTLKLFIQ